MKTPRKNAFEIKAYVDGYDVAYLDDKHGFVKTCKPSFCVDIEYVVLDHPHTDIMKQVKLDSSVVVELYFDGEWIGPVKHSELPINEGAQYRIKPTEWPQDGDAFKFYDTFPYRGKLGKWGWAHEEYDSKSLMQKHLMDIGNFFKEDDENAYFKGYKILEALHAWNTAAAKYGRGEFSPQFTTDGVALFIVKYPFIGASLPRHNDVNECIKEVGEDKVKLLLGVE